jgi:hypothetical protein
MFNFFRSVSEPEVSKEHRHYFENQFHWLIENFGEELLTKEIKIPDQTDFPIVYAGTETPAWKTLNIICAQMDIDPDEIHLDFYSEGINEINAGPQNIYLQASRKSKYANGLYWGRGEDGKYHIGVNNNLLKNPEGLVGTLAHELAHARLLGEKKLHSKYDKDHELITEMFCVFSGFGIFKALQAFRINKGFDGWSYASSGYLRQQSWGYLLALYAFIRNEENPSWLKFLTPSLEKDFNTSMKWLEQTDAGEKFLAAKWKNNYSENPMENINLSGEWLKQSTYGSSYSEKYAGKTHLSEVVLKDDEGQFSGTAKDMDGAGVQNADAIIKGTIRNNSIEFSLTYNFSDKVNEEGIIVRKAEKEPYTVSYNGYYSPFLNVIIGEWEIRLPDQGKQKMIGGRGTFEMKREKLQIT